MSIIKDLQNAMTNIGKIADAVSVATNGAPVPADTVGTPVPVPPADSSTGNVTVAVPAPAPSTAEQTVETVLKTGLEVAGFIPGTASIVKILTAAQQLYLVVEEVKTDIETQHPDLWAEITAVFPALAKKL